MSGWISISRSIFDHPFFPREPMSEREAWVWMIARAAYEDTRHKIGNDMVDVPRGSFFCTLRGLQQAWGWGSDFRVRAFLKRTQAERMTTIKTNAGKTHIAICNYDEFQSFNRTENAQKTHDTQQNERTKITKNKKQNNISCALALRFGEFWGAYPHRGGVKRGREVSEKAYAKALASGVSEADLIEAATRYATDRRVRDGYAKDPATWLNQKCWQDEIDATKAPAADPQYGDIRVLADGRKQSYHPFDGWRWFYD